MAPIFTKTRAASDELPAVTLICEGPSGPARQALVDAAGGIKDDEAPYFDEARSTLAGGQQLPPVYVAVVPLAAHQPAEPGAWGPTHPHPTWIRTTREQADADQAADQLAATAAANTRASDGRRDEQDHADATADRCDQAARWGALEDSLRGIVGELVGYLRRYEDLHTPARDFHGAGLVRDLVVAMSPVTPEATRHGQVALEALSEILTWEAPDA